MDKSNEELVLPYTTPSIAPSSTWSVKVRLAPNVIRQELSVFLGEFIGTFMFLFFAFAGTQIALESTTIKPFTLADQSSPPEVGKLLYISFAFSISLAINVAIFADVSGGMFNPAVTTALWIIGLIRWPRALHSIFAQFLASICSAFVTDALQSGPLRVTTVLDPSVSVPRGLFLEVFLTAQLILAILMVPAGSSKPMYIGMALFVAEMAGVFSTGGSLNPARSFGPAVVVGFQSSDWIYWLGPLMGAGLGGGAFALIKGVQSEKNW